MAACVVGSIKTARQLAVGADGCKHTPILELGLSISAQTHTPTIRLGHVGYLLPSATSQEVEGTFVATTHKPHICDFEFDTC